LNFSGHELAPVDLGLLADSAAKASSLERFAAELALDPPQSSADLAGPPKLDEDHIVMSTLHLANDSSGTSST
jgi:ATP-dependent DNA helicase UvrD/PcrA